MKIDEFGYWWLPENPGQHTAGRLIFDDESEGKLSIINKNRDPFSKELTNYDAIHGISTEGKYYSLFQCFDQNIKHNSKGVVTNEIYVGMLLKGFLLKSIKEKKIKKAYIKFQNLDKWLGITGIKIDHNKKFSRLNVLYKKPRSKKIKINDDLSIEISVFANYPLSQFWSKDYCIGESANIIVMTKKYESIEYYQRVTKIIQGFLTVVCNKFSHPDDITFVGGKRQKLKGKYIFEEGNLFASRFFTGKSAKTESHFDFLFTYSQIKNDFEQAIKLWFEKYDTIEPIINLYISALYAPKTFLEIEFLYLIQALESYHRRFCKENKYEKEEHFKKNILPLLTNSIPDNIDNAFRESMIKRLCYLNEFSLSKRLKLIVKDYKKTIEYFVPKIGSIIGEIVEYRNYYTHYEESILKNKNVDYEKLIQFVDIVKFIVDICFLKEMGLSKNKIDMVFRNNLYYLRLFNKKVR